MTSLWFLSFIAIENLLHILRIFASTYAYAVGFITSAFTFDILNLVKLLLWKMLEW